MAETGPAPSAPAAALAARRELGEWAQATYLPKKRLFSQRWADARLHLFTRGLVITGPEGFLAAYDWASATVLQSLTTVNGGLADARYTPLDGSGTAVAIGRGNDLLTGRQRERLGITALTRGAPFVHEGTWGPHLQQCIAGARTPGTLAALERGDTAGFGVIELSAHGLTVTGHFAPWSDFDAVCPSNGHLTFPTPRRRRRALSSVPLHEIPNLGLLLQLCRRFGK